MRKSILAAVVAAIFVASPLAAQRDGLGTGSRETKPADEVTKEGEKKEEASTGVKFLHDLEPAIEQARKEEKKLFIVFSTTWCGPCKMLERNVWSKDEFAADLAKVAVAVYLDGDVKRAEVQRFGVRGYPTVILADADGKEVGRQVGARLQTPAAWSNWIATLSTGADSADEIKREAEETSDPVKLAEAAQKMLDLGRDTEAIRLFRLAEEAIGPDGDAELRTEVRLKRATLLLRGIRSSSDLTELMEDLIPSLIKAKDERIINPTMQYSNIVARNSGRANNPLHARQLLLDLREAFPKHEQVRGMRCMAAMYAHLAGDGDTAVAEMKQFLAEDEKAGVRDTWSTRAQRLIDAIERGTENFR